MAILPHSWAHLTLPRTTGPRDGNGPMVVGGAVEIPLLEVWPMVLQRQVEQVQNLNM